MSKESNEREQKAGAQEIVLDDNAILEAIIQYMQEKHSDGRVVDVEWLLYPEEGYELPPIKGIAVRCTME